MSIPCTAPQQVPRTTSSCHQERTMNSKARNIITAFARAVCLALTYGCLLVWGSSVDAEPAARTVRYAETDIVPIHAKIRFSTLIVLPPNEEILDATTGDKEFWIINGSHNLCFLHTAQQGIRSNLNLIKQSGHVYSFLLTEVSKDPNVAPDLKIF